MKTTREISELIEQYRMEVYDNYKMSTKLSSALLIAATKEAHYDDCKTPEVFAARFANYHKLMASNPKQYRFELLEKAMYAPKKIPMASVEDCEQVKAIYEAFKRYEERENV